MMETLTQLLPRGRKSPRLWIERLDIFSEPDEAHVLRTVSFQRGLNLVWAKEPEVGRAQGTRAAGHGVGKTSLCLLLRFCLGESSKAVGDLRDELTGELPKGGVVAVVHLDDQPFTLCRYFNPYKEGAAFSGSHIDIWGRDAEFSDRDFLKKLADDMTGRVLPKNIPETNQLIEWKHALAWISRDQGSRFKSFFAWREGEGSGLQRSRQDPPIVMRAILGLLESGESDLMQQLARQEAGLAQTKLKTERLRQEPELIRRRIESNLRTLGNLPDELPIHAPDLFSDSVEKRINEASAKASIQVSKWERDLEEADQAVADLKAEMKIVAKALDKAQAEYDYAEAARRGEEEAFQEAGKRLLKLKQLDDYCQEGGLPFKECQHIKEEIRRLDSTTDMRDVRDKKALQAAMSESAGRSVQAFQRKSDVEKKLANMRREQMTLEAAQTKVRIAKRTAEIDANKWPALLAELDRWEKNSGSKKAQDDIEASQLFEKQLEAEMNRTHTKLHLLQQSRSDREKALANITDELTRKLLPDGAIGTFDPRDEFRPFRLSMRGGEAYRVLEVLLGDVACMLDSPRLESSLPGLFIHDCPREADMSSGLYENFLSLINSIQRAGYSNGVIPFQYIVTTTTPPPHILQGDEVCLTLDPSSENGLLFCRRFVGVRQEALS